MTIAAILTYRTGEGVYNLVMSLLFDILAPLVQAVVGITSDLWHSNPNYSKQTFRISVSILRTAFSLVSSIILLVVGSLRK
jgi:uncharacterized membrane protein YagU involved in acid resistance